MTRGTRRLAPRPSKARRIALVAAPLVTVAAVSTGVASTGLTGPDETSASLGASALSPVLGHISGGASLGGRELAVTRDFDRMALAGASNVEPPKPVDERWTTEVLDIRQAPAEDAKVFGEIDAFDKVAITGREIDGYAEIVREGVARWVTADYLVEEKPSPEEVAVRSISTAPCPDGSSIEAGLQPGAVKVYRAVCAAFPELSSYGGQDGHGEHVNGEAIDFMVPSFEVGERVKDYLYAHHAEFGLFDIIWAQQIWTIERSGEGFRPMSDRGSATANHFDHVHIKIL